MVDSLSGYCRFQVEMEAASHGNPPDTSDMMGDGKLQGQRKMNRPSQEPHKRFYGLTVEPVLFLALVGANMSSAY